MAELLPILQQYLAEDPLDPFNHYAYGLEMAKRDKGKAMEVMEHLRATFPAYLPTYYSAGNLCLDLELQTQALEWFSKGIELARQQGNNKTLGELQNAYTNTLAEMD